MSTYLAKRLVGTLPVLLGVAALLFLLFHVVGEDPARVALGQHASPDAVAALRHRWHLDQPLGVQFLAFLREVVTFDYGRSFVTHEPLSRLLAAGAGVSLRLTVPPFVLGTLLSIALSLVVSAQRERWPERVTSIVAVGAMSVSYLAMIVVAQYVLAYRFGWFPVGGYTAELQGARSLALPWLILLVVGLGADIRIYHALLRDEALADYVRTARAKGAREARVYGVHVLRNALPTILTHALGAIPTLMLGSFLLERYFSLPGLGDLLISALHNGDFPILKGLTMTLALAYSGLLLVSDLLHAYLDPRVRLS